MTAFLSTMAAPFAACLLLVLIHGALGRHVLARGVIFVDLALAQTAALGAAVGMVLGELEPGEPALYLWSFGFTLVGALLFSFFWDRGENVLQEAFIGIAFALASAASILVLANTPHGMEEFHAAVSGGGLLWLGWSDVASMALFYGVAGALLYWKEPVLWLCSTDPKAAVRKGHSLKVWDFFFYAVFGLVVTSSVKYSGVLAVFSFLIMPGVCAALLGKKGGSGLRLAWGLGILGSVLAMALSYFKDYPTGASVVCSFGLLVILVTLIKRFRRASA